MAIFNYFLKKMIRDFDYKVLNSTECDEDLYICNGCTRISNAKYYLNFNKLTKCIYCNSCFEDLNTHIINNNMNHNNRILKI